MCGRFTIITTPEALAAQFGLDALTFDWPGAMLPNRFNVAPTQAVLVLRARPSEFPGDAKAGMLGPALMQWGLVPSWAADPRIGARMINARADSVAVKPSYRTALKRRRCLIPANGFYEWQKKGKGKQPYYIRVRGGGLFAFAGLWEMWTGGGESALESFTIITTEPNELVAPIHDRMPVIVRREDYALWTDARVDAAEKILPLLKAYPAEEMEAWPVSAHVNSPGNDDPNCIRPSDEGPGDIVNETRKKNADDDEAPSFL